MERLSILLTGLTIEPSIGWLGAIAIAAGLACVVAAYTSQLRWRNYSLRTRALLMGCRLGAALCLLVALLQPSWQQETTTRRKPVLAVVLDDSLSMSKSADASADSTLAVSRYAKALEILGKQVLPAIGDVLDLRIYDVQGRPIDPNHLPELPADTQSPLTATLLKVQQDLRLLPTAKQVYSITSSDKSLPIPAPGILLLSDGTQMTDEPVAPGIDRLLLPVHAIEIAKPEPPATAAPDVAIEAVSVNRHARVGNTVQAIVDLVAEGAVPAGPLLLSILDGTNVLASQALNLKEGERARRAEVEFTLRRPGDLTLTVHLAPVPGETILANNRQTFPIAVRAKPLTVLFIDGVLRWEGKFIRQALSDDPDINVVASIRTARAGSDRGSQGLLLPEQLASVSLVILGDVEASYFSADEITALRAWVTDHRGALLVTGGYHSFGPEGFGRSDLREILPVEFSAAANPQIEQPFQLKLTEIGSQSPIFHLSGDRVRDTAFFQALPPLAGCSRIAGVKPGAQVLAVNPAATSPDGSQGLPVLIEQQVGTGRTVVLAVDTTWRWRTVVGGFTGDASFYTRFWGQLARWMIGAEETAPQQLFVSTDRKQYKMGQTIEMNITLQDLTSQTPQTQPTMSRPADWSGPAAGSPPPWELAAMATDEKGNRLTVPLADLGHGRYRGSLGASQPGRWDLLVMAQPPAGTIQSSAEPVSKSSTDGRANEPRFQSQIVTVDVSRPGREMLNTRPDIQWLAQITQRTGGRLLQPDQVAGWAKDLPHTPIEVSRYRAVELWHHPVLAMLFLGLLCTEWFLRRRNRLM